MVRTFPVISAAALLAGCTTMPPPNDSLGSLSQIGETDPRFLSYNVEMVEVTGGRFWRPYDASGSERYEYRPPLDLSDVKLQHLAAALGPAYVRVSGTWANATWFADSDEAPSKAPPGFDTVLTRKQWRGVIDFVKAIDGELVTSVATSPGTRDADGVWQPDTATRLFSYTREIGGRIAATEFANEPNMLWLTQPPAGYTGEAYRRDYAAFAEWLRAASPGTALLAPGVAELGEPTRTMAQRNQSRQILQPEDLIAASSPRPDAFSFHFYGGGSIRCGGGALGMTLENALTPSWLDSVDPAITRVSRLRDAVAPGTPLWNTESAESSCGGNPWAATFADTFRFVDTLGRSARQGVRVYIHNTLSASDYALLDEHGNVPRPNYWAAVLWKRTMGTKVLMPPPSPAAAIRIYAHCSLNSHGGVSLAMINTGETEVSIPIDREGRAWLLESSNNALDTKAILINGRPPQASERGELSGLGSKKVFNSVSLPRRSVAFVTVDDARNPVCR